MTGGSVLSKTADGLLGAQKWLDEHPSVKFMLNHLGAAAGIAMWIKNITPVGLLMGVVGVAVNAAYEKGLNFFGEDIAEVQEKFSSYLLSIDSDLNKEQGDILASTAIKFMKEAGRMGIQWGTSKGVNALKNRLGGKGPRELEMKDNKGMKGDAAKAKPTTLKPLGLGSTGRTEASNLVEQMAMKAAMENPKLGDIVIKEITDPRWLGWTKMRYKVETDNGIKVIIDYVAKWENRVLKAVDDNLNL